MENRNPNSAAPQSFKKKELSDHERTEVVATLLGASKVGKLTNSFWEDLAKKFDVRPRNLRRVWQHATQSRAAGKVVFEEICSKSKERGKNRRRWDEHETMEETKKIPFRNRTTWEALAAQLDIPETTLRRFNKKGVFRHTSPLKPFLTEEHRVARLTQCLSKIDDANPTKYRNLCDEVHVDEKWFCLTEDGQTFTLAEGEDPPKRKVQHKGHITKTMFICAQARPRMVNGRMWDGKIGIWPIGRVEPAKINSKNRPAGTPEWKNVSIDREKYRQLMISLVLPAIIAQFPWDYLTRRTVCVQQDGARSHILDNDEEWLEAVELTGCNIKLYTQAAQSPDLNINDLAFFRSIQSLKKKEAPRTAFELIDAVKRAHALCPVSKINRMWLTLMQVMNEIIKDQGGNDFKLPHMYKNKLEREGNLPRVLDVTEEVERYR